jgi:hypothetical protein
MTSRRFWEESARSRSSWGKEGTGVDQNPEKNEGAVERERGYEVGIEDQTLLCMLWCVRGVERHPL